MRLLRHLTAPLLLMLASTSFADQPAPATHTLKTFGVSVQLMAAGLQLREPASIGSLAMPVYPAALLNAGIRGECEVLLDLKEDGSIARVTLGRSSNEQFSASALTAVRSWRFPKWKWISKPQVVRITATFTFTYSDD